MLTISLLAVRYFMLALVASGAALILFTHWKRRIQVVRPVSESVPLGEVDREIEEEIAASEGMRELEGSRPGMAVNSERVDTERWASASYSPDDSNRKYRRSFSPVGHGLSRNRLVMIMAFVSVLLLAGCRKEKVPVEELLLAGSWLTEDVQVYGAGYNGESVIDICNLDNTIRFNRNGTALFDFGTVKCDTSEERLYLVEWQLSQDQKYLEMGGLKYELSLLTSQYLRCYVRDFSLPGIAGPVDMYFRWVRE